MDRVRFRLGLADSLGLGNLVPVAETEQNPVTCGWNSTPVSHCSGPGWRKGRLRSQQPAVTSASLPTCGLLATTEEIREKYLSSRAYLGGALLINVQAK